MGNDLVRPAQQEHEHTHTAGYWGSEDMASRQQPPPANKKARGREYGTRDGGRRAAGCSHRRSHSTAGFLRSSRSPTRRLHPPSPWVPPRGIKSPRGSRRPAPEEGVATSRGIQISSRRRRSLEEACAPSIYLPSPSLHFLLEKLDISYRKIHDFWNVAELVCLERIGRGNENPGHEGYKISCLVDRYGNLDGMWSRVWGISPTHLNPLRELRMVGELCYIIWTIHLSLRHHLY